MPSSHTTGRDAIVQAALAELPGVGGTIGLAAGPRSEQLAAQVPVELDLAVVTNSLPIAQMLASRGMHTVVLVGGHVRPHLESTAGEQAVHMLGLVNVQVAFLDAEGLSVQAGLTLQDSLSAAVQHSFVASAGKCVALADRAALGTVHRHRVAPIAQVDVVITDSTSTDPHVVDLRACGPRVVLRPDSTTPTT